MIMKIEFVCLSWTEPHPAIYVRADQVEGLDHDVGLIDVLFCMASLYHSLREGDPLTTELISQAISYYVLHELSHPEEGDTDCNDWYDTLHQVVLS